MEAFLKGNKVLMILMCLDKTYLLKLPQQISYPFIYDHFIALTINSKKVYNNFQLDS